MAVAKRCDRCGKYYEGKRSNQCKIVQDGEDFYINSVRIGDWNALAKNWNNLASGYDICADCMKEIAAFLSGKEKVQGEADSSFAKVL